MLTVPISYSPMFDSNPAFYPMICTNRICPCTFNSSYNSYSSSFSNGGSPTYTPSSSPTTTVASLFAPSSPTFGPPIHQSANLVLSTSTAAGSLSVGKFLFNPTASHPFNQPYATLFNGSSYSSSIPYAKYACQTAATKRFVFTPGSWKQS